MKRAIVSAGLLAGLLHAGVAHASLTIDYFTIAETDKDANRLAFGAFSNEVQNALGPDGLPVLNRNANNGVGLPTDLTSSGEITYWSPALNNGGPGGTSDVTATGSATVSLPFNRPDDFFPPNGTGTSDSNGFQAAILTGTLDAPTTEQISFNIGADDSAFAYLDGQVVCDLGGVHADTAGACVSPFDISAGSHSLEVFFVDLHTYQSALTFGVDTQGVTTSVPEPASLAVLGLGLTGLGLIRRRARG